MKNKKILSFVLAIVMLLSSVPMVFAEGVPTITVSTANIAVGETKVNIPVSVTGFSSSAVSGLRLEFALDSGLAISNASLSTAATKAGFEIDNAGFANGIVSVNCDTDHMFTGVTVNDGELLTLELTVASDATGTLNVALSDNQSNYLNSSYVNIGNVSVIAGSVTIGTTGGETPTDPTDPVNPTDPTNPPAGGEDGDEDEPEYTITEGIKLTASASNDYPVCENATNPIKVNVGVGETYAATEMTITYPSDKVSFNKTASTLGTATITDDSKGTLTLADYGDDKAAGTENYVLAFTVGNTTGAAEFKVTEAGLGTGTSAADKNLTAVATDKLGSVTITIVKAKLNVTLPNDGLFYAEQTIVDAGKTFTFYPEQENGSYYVYQLPTATMGGEAVTVTPTADGTGWQIENVTGDIVIAAGVRNPKNFGEITYSGTGAEYITNKTKDAVYGTDISFTIPADVEPGIDTGIKYEAIAQIGGSNYTLGTPTEDEDGSRTYTIPGNDVKGSVTITVTATVLEASKVTVSIAGEKADGTLNNAEAGASVQVDKNNGSATLTVDMESGLNKGYNYEVTTSTGTLTKNENGTYTITGLTSNATITINKTINVEGVKNQVEVGGENKSFLTLDSTSGNQMWLIQLPNHVKNTTTAVYKYNGQQMYWSADHNNYVLVVIGTEAPIVTADKFTLEEVSQTPTVAAENWDVNKSGTVDANDAQLIWNMYKSVYTEFSTAADGTGATVEKFMLADANHDGILDLTDATVIINKILGISG